MHNPDNSEGHSEAILLSRTLENFAQRTYKICALVLFSVCIQDLMVQKFHQICLKFHLTSKIPWNMKNSTEPLEHSNRYRLKVRRFPIPLMSTWNKMVATLSLRSFEGLYLDLLVINLNGIFFSTCTKVVWTQWYQIWVVVCRLLYRVKIHPFTV